MTFFPLSAAMLCPCCKAVFERCERCPQCGEVAHVAIESLADGVVEAIQERIDQLSNDNLNHAIDRLEAATEIEQVVEVKYRERW